MLSSVNIITIDILALRVLTKLILFLFFNYNNYCTYFMQIGLENCINHQSAALSQISINWRVTFSIRTIDEGQPIFFWFWIWPRIDASDHFIFEILQFPTKAVVCSFIVRVHNGPFEGSKNLTGKNIKGR